MFLFKKIVAPLFFPLPLCFLLIAAGLALLWFSRRQKTGKVIVTSGFAVLVVLTYGWVSDPLLRSLVALTPRRVRRQWRRRNGSSCWAAGRPRILRCHPARV